jgi:hypothetical protein
MRSLYDRNRHYPVRRTTCRLVIRARSVQKSVIRTSGTAQPHQRLGEFFAQRTSHQREASLNLPSETLCALRTRLETLSKRGTPARDCRAIGPPGPRFSPPVVSGLSSSASKQRSYHEEAGENHEGPRRSKDSGASRGRPIKHRAKRYSCLRRGPSCFFLVITLLAGHGSHIRPLSPEPGRNRGESKITSVAVAIRDGLSAELRARLTTCLLAAPRV